MRALSFILILWIAHDLLWIADRPPPLPFVQADYEACAKVNPGPLRPHQKPVLYPNNSELS
jgi:hypothetical protein